MNRSYQEFKGSTPMKNMKGVTLIDVLLAMVVFAVGMLALAHLQTNLTRSSSDGNLRTVATNVGEEIIERARSYARVRTDPDGILLAFADIDDDWVEQWNPIRRGEIDGVGGVDYTVTGAVSGYNFDDDRIGATEIFPAVAGEVYDFRLVELTISWDNNADFQIDEGAGITTADMGTGSVTIRQVVPSIPVLASAKIAAEDEEGGGPPVKYTPGLNPDIVAIDLEGAHFKETTTAQPVLIHGDQLVETWFEVVTYNASDPEALFLRREEFLTVSCECELNLAGGVAASFLPTVWNGTYYNEGTWVSKPYGESANNNQSFYCSTCCRDHHDGADGFSGNDEVYDPQKTWVGPAGNDVDHEHYGRSRRGDWVLAENDGDSYVEACRMVRKDGFMRVAQDFRQEGLNSFPYDYLDEDPEVAEYSDYVTDSVEDFYELGLTELTLPAAMAPPVIFPASLDSNPTTLPTSGGDNAQQLRSRGIYVDNVSAEAKVIIDCMIDLAPAADSGDECGAPGAESYLEVLPFFEIQMTLLSWWNENSAGDPVCVGNLQRECPKDERGIASKTSEEPELVTVDTTIHRGNIGFTVTDPISPYDTSVAEATAAYDLYISANEGDGTGVVGNTVSGIFNSGVGGVDSGDATVTPGSGTSCSRSITSLSCTTDLLNVTGSITISGYLKGGTDLWVCIAADTFPTAVISGVVFSGSAKTTTITWTNLPTDVEGIILTIENSSC